MRLRELREPHADRSLWTLRGETRALPTLHLSAAWLRRQHTKRARRPERLRDKLWRLLRRPTMWKRKAPRAPQEPHQENSK